MATPNTEKNKLLLHSLVYLIPALLSRGLSFLLTPLYTRTLTSSEYGLINIATPLTALLSIAFGLATHGSITRLYFEFETEKERRQFFGTLTLFLGVGSILFAGTLHVVGILTGLHLFRSLPFDPYLQIVIWTAALSVFSPIPITAFTAMEKPGRAVFITEITAVVQVLLTLWFVVGRRQGFIGVLYAALLSSAVNAVISLIATTRIASFSFSLLLLRRILKFSLPIVPHLLAGWTLAVSDRLILEHYATDAEVGVYALGYLIGFAVALVVNAITTALGPIAIRHLKDPTLSSRVPEFGDIAFSTILLVCTLAVVFAPEAIAILAPPSYRGALRFVPWIVIGMLFQGVYLINSTGTWFSMRTAWVSWITVIAGAFNVVVNLIFVPRFGAIVAAISTMAAYALSAVLHGILANKLHRIDWNYLRWSLLVGVAAACTWFLRWTGMWFGWWTGIVFKLVVLLTTFTATLFALRIVTATHVRSLALRFRRRS